MPAPGTSGKMPESRNTVTGVFCRMANTRVRMVTGNHRQQAGRSGAQPKHDAQLIHEPAHGTHQRTGGQAPAGAGEQDGKAQGAGAGQQELAHQLPDLGIGERNHATTTPVSREYRPSTRPVPMAMLAAMSSASIMRMVPDR